jgi:type IV secretory pathway VirB4 component
MPKNFANAQDLVTIEEIKDNTVVLKSGELRQVLMVGGVNFSLKSESEQNIITSGYQNFLNSLSFPIQIIIHSRKINAEKYLRALDDRRAQEGSALLQDQIGEYQEFIRSFVKENAIMAKTFFVVVPFAPVVLPSKDTMLGFLPFFKKTGPDAAADAARESNFKEELQQLSQRVSQVTDGLVQIGLDVVLLNDEQLVELFYNFYNPESTEKQGVAAPQK